MDRARRAGSLAPLVPHYEAQRWPSFCGIASAVTILKSFEQRELEMLNQWTFFRETVGPIRRSATVALRGMSMEALAAAIEGYGVDALPIYGADLDPNSLSGLLSRCSDPTVRLVVNYSRRAVGQAGFGHFSPILAFDGLSDRGLILDVASRFEPVWITSSDLLDAMLTIDRGTKRTRGLVLVTCPD